VKPPTQAEVDAGLRRITQALVEWGARKVILFGSVACGDYSASSDIDLIVVRESTDRLPQRISEALGRCESARPPLPIEAVVYTPDEFDRLVASENPFVREAQRHGRILHDEARA
jgi:predicted nucleotidyltransferase